MPNKTIQFFAILVLFTHSDVYAIRPTDIVGRNLDLPGVENAGHVGIATADKSWQEAQYVIEAFWEQPVLQINALDSFKRKSPYWGAKFGINKNDVSGTRIINEGAFQASLKCAEYTTTARWKAGTGQ